MVENSFSFNSKDFKLNKINALKQYHIARRISPILGEVMPVFSKIAKANTENLPEDQKLEQMILLAEPLLKGFAKMSEADSEKLLHDLLMSVEMKQSSGNWAKLSNGDSLMFSDLDLKTMLVAAGKAFMFNLSDFFGALQRSS
jgi:hypothetical protein